MCEGSRLRWPRYLASTQYALNTAVHTTTGVQPHFAFFSRHVERQVGPSGPLIENDSDDSLKVAHEAIRETSARMSKGYREKVNDHRKEECVKVGDLTWVRVEIPEPGTSRKLNPKWKGPYKVIEVIRGGAAYELVNPFDEEDTLRRAAEKVKRYIPRDLLILEQSTSGEDNSPLCTTTEDSTLLDLSDLGVEEVEGATALPRYPSRTRKPVVRMDL